MTEVYGYGLSWQPTSGLANVHNLPCDHYSGCIGTCQKTYPNSQTGIRFIHTLRDDVDCLDINPVVCNLAGVQAVRTEWQGGIHPEPIGNNPPVGPTDQDVKQKCTYHAEDFTTLDQVRAFINAYQNSANPDFQTNFDKIMMNFCTFTSNQCNNATFGRGYKCSNLRDTTEIGDFCRQWFNNTTTANQNTIGQNYCSQNDTEECQCINRSKNPIYKAAAQAASFKDCCWWLPCKNPSNYFVPTDQTPCDTCPTTVCQAVVEVYNSKHVNFPNAGQYINCPGIENGGGPITPTDSSTFWIAAIIIAILVIVIVLIVPPFQAFVLSHLLIISLVIFIIFGSVGGYVWYNGDYTL